MLIHYMRKQRDNKCMGTGAYGETQKGEGQTNGGEGRILRKINSFCEMIIQKNLTDINNINNQYYINNSKMGE